MATRRAAKAQRGSEPAPPASVAPPPVPAAPQPTLAAAARRCAARLLDPEDEAAAMAVGLAIVLAEVVLCGVIIAKVPYTEIDWKASV